jgi:hypothetical protein
VKARLSLPERFWSKVEKIPFHECWEWSGPTYNGYGMFVVQNKNKRAHRVAYELCVGPIPPGLVLDHLCRNPSCVRPDHLEAVTDRGNILRGVGATARNAVKTHCVHGHPLEGANCYRGPAGAFRECRTCLRKHKYAYLARKAQAAAEGRS